MLHERTLRIFTVAFFIALLGFIGLFSHPVRAQALPFTIDLEYGMRGLEVRMLQEFLAPRGYFDHIVTGNFLDVTRASVQAWQRDNCVPATGYFGPISRSVVNGLVRCTVTSPSNPNTSDSNTSNSGIASVFTTTQTPAKKTTSVGSRSGRVISEDEEMAAISVSVSPTTANSQVKATTTFTATVSNASDSSVTWSASGGSISGSGVFTAPSSVAATTTYTITAASVEDSSKEGTATVTVVPVVVRISPTSTSTLGGTTATFSATVVNATTSAVTWSASGGSINSSGVFTAPGVSATTTYTITASSTVDSSRAATATVQVTPDESFVGWWKLDEGSGTLAVDSSGNGNDGTWTGTQSGNAGYYHTDGAPTFDFAGSFSSGDDVVTISSIDIGEARTIAFWAYIPSLSGTTEMISKSSSGQGVEVIINSDTIQFYVMGSSVVGLSAEASDITTGAWNHIVATYNGANSTMRIYINGEQSGGTATAPGTIGIVDALRFGDWADGNRDFTGRLNDIRMYTELYTAQQVADLYDTYQ